MESIEIELKVLIECLKKKEQVLKQIADITENQGFVLASDAEHSEKNTFFMNMNEEKQEFINKVLEYDQVFENVLEKIGPTLDADTSKYSEEVNILQKSIRAVTDWDVRIRNIETKNNEILEKALADIQAANIVTEKGEKPEPLSRGEYGNNKMIKAYRSQSRHYTRQTHER